MNRRIIGSSTSGAILVLGGLALAIRSWGAEIQPMPYGDPIELCRLRNSEIRESSGLAISRRNPNWLWTHNDSGDEPRLFCFNRRGEHLGTCKLAGARAIDWEDMCSFVLDGQPKLLVADTGDNLRRRGSVSVLIVDEPTDPKDDQPAMSQVRLRFETGPTDCEAVAVDPGLRKILLIEKKLSLFCRVFEAPLPSGDPPRDLLAAAIADIRVPVVTAMDISPDGRRAIVLTLGQAFEFSRSTGESWAEAFARTPRKIDMPARRQGESICYGADGRELLLTSEQLPTPLFLVPTKEAAASSPP